MSFARNLNRILAPWQPESSDPMMPQCDSCPKQATAFYKSQPRNKSQQPEYHAFCADHDSPFEETGRISLEQYVCEYIHES